MANIMTKTEIKANYDGKIEDNKFNSLDFITVIAVSIVVTMLNYPFIATSDGLKRFDRIVFDDKGFTVLPQMQEYILSLFFEIEGNVALYTFVQCILFFTSLIILVNCFVGRKCSFIIFLTFLINPIFVVFPTILTDSSIVLSCIAILSAYLVKSVGSYRKGSETVIIVFSCVFVMFGYRTNSLVIIPIILIITLFMHPKNRLQAIAATCLATVAVAHVNWEFRQQARPEALSMAWEIVGVAKQIPSSDKLGKALDFCGDTQEAIKRYHSRFLNPIFWDNPPLPVQCIVSPSGADQVQSKYIEVILNHFGNWISVKKELSLGVYGFNLQLEPIMRGIGPVDQSKQFWGIHQMKNQVEMLEWFREGENVLGPIVNRPFVISGLSILFVLLCIMLKIKNSKSLLVPLVMSNAYYSGFLIFSQSMEFRYFAPTFFMNYMIVSVSITLISIKLFDLSRSRMVIKLRYSRLIPR